MFEDKKLRPLLMYWRNTVNDGELINVRRTNSCVCEWDDLAYGVLPPALTRVLFERKKKISKNKPPANSEQDTNSKFIDVIIGVASIQRRWGERKGKDDAGTSTLLYIPAGLSQQGFLFPSEDRLPWIPRNHLDPTPDFAVGTLDSYDRFATRTSRPEDPVWSDFWAYANRLFEAVSGEVLASYSPAGFERLDPWIQPDAGSVGSIKALIDGYDYLLDEGCALPPLLKRLVSGATPKVFQGCESKDVQRHVGQMRGDFGLAHSQRDSLACALRLQKGEILAINGPPGTGKTTLLQSIIASLWVRTALGAPDALPPIILGCSTNNQAVTNILDSFVASGDNTDPLFRRWIPVKTYGLWFPSHEALKKNDGNTKYEFTTIQFCPGRRWAGTPKDIENQDFVDKASIDYQNSARDYLSFVPHTIEETVGLLRSHLKDEERSLAGLVQVTQNASDALKLAGLANAQTVAEAKVEALQHHASGREEIVHWKGVLGIAQKDRSRERRAQSQALSAFAPHSFLQRLLGWKPKVKALRLERAIERYRETCDDPPLQPFDNIKQLKAYWSQRLEQLQRRVDEAAQLVAQLRSQLAEAKKNRVGALTALKIWEDQFSRFKQDPRLGEAEGLLDRHSRFKMFHLAARYWEGRWLLEMQQRLTDEDNLHLQSRYEVGKRFRRWAMLFPCFVSTLHTAPRIFVYYTGTEHPLHDFIDMIVVDEAGQISPELSAPTLALGRKAVIVGDVHQIQPIWTFTPGIDHANMVRNIFDTKVMQERSLACTGSSVMRLASLATKWTRPDADGEPGLFLSEHRRCKDPIIAFCNDLVYCGELIPLAGSEGNGITPMMGHCHLRNPSTSVGGSRYNVGDAQTIARWIKDGLPAFTSHYQKPIGDIIAIVTPFRAQVDCLIEALEKLKIPTGQGGVTVGTVHAMQGAERPIVLFSPAVSRSAGEARTFFFDCGPNMLNVAVSRAKDSFITFGDMRVFDPKGHTPSACLARHLFADENNEITGLEEIPLQIEGVLDQERISTLSRHRQVLRYAIEQAQSRLLIVSPFLSAYALQDDNLPEILGAAVQRGVKVCIVTAPEMNRDPGGRLKVSYDVGVQQLESVGCTVLQTDRVHNKTIAVDDTLIIDGSFNWLSAVRNANHMYCRRETSTISRGEKVKAAIESEWLAYPFDTETNAAY